jgi:mono/diheme cytochrome c family protein
MKPLSITALAVFIAGCTNDQLQRMVEQPKYLPYAENDFFEDGRAMRTPPPGTVAREGHPIDPALEARGPNGAYVETIPIPITLAVLRLGQHHFQITCAACHGLLGDGNSVVAEKMSLRPPPSIHDFIDRPEGFFYAVISEGYGLMPSYADRISPLSRWAVVAYLRALQLSQRAKLADAPTQVQTKLLREPR